MEQLNGNIKISCICLSLLCSIVFCFNSYSDDCNSSVRPINKGEPAQCTGYLFSPSAESAAYKATRISELQKEENEILQKRLDLYIKQSEVLAKEIAKRDSTEDLKRLGMFVLGVVVTGYIASNLK